MPADNSIYNSNSNGWWDENNYLNTLKTGINPARFEYFLVTISALGVNLSTLEVIDIGCGGGILSEEFARAGCTVTGVDISPASLVTALRHSQLSQLSIHYLAGSAQSVPLASASFDLALCCDVLEHVPNLGSTIAEVARLLKPGGLFLFDTINRTIQSYFEHIFVAQVFPLTRFFPSGTHDWHQFIQPLELKKHLADNNLILSDIQGLRPGVTNNQTSHLIRQLKSGQINYAEFGHRLKFQVGGGLNGSYIGYAVKKY